MGNSDENYNIFEDDSYMSNPTSITVYGINYDIEFFNKHKKEILDKSSPFNTTNKHLLVGKEVIY